MTNRLCFVVLYGFTLDSRSAVIQRGFSPPGSCSADVEWTIIYRKVKHSHAQMDANETLPENRLYQNEFSWNLHLFTRFYPSQLGLRSRFTLSQFMHCLGIEPVTLVLRAPCLSYRNYNCRQKLVTFCNIVSIFSVQCPQTESWVKFSSYWGWFHKKLKTMSNV